MTTVLGHLIKNVALLPLLPFVYCCMSPPVVAIVVVVVAIVTVLRVRINIKSSICRLSHLVFKLRFLVVFFFFFFGFWHCQSFPINLSAF